MKRFLVIAALLAACGDDHPTTPSDSGSDSGSGSDGGVVTPMNFTTYVIDLVQNHTTATETPRAFTEFSTLDDPDGMTNNGSAYSPLFP